MPDYQPESFLLLFLYHLEFHKSQEFWETVNLVTQILLMWMAQDPCSFLRVFILHDNIQALCVATLSAEELGVVFKNNLKGFTLGINFHTLFDFFLPAIRNFDASSVLPPVSATLHENIHKRVFMTYLRMSTHKESKVNMQACCNVLKRAVSLIVRVGSRFCHIFLRIRQIASVAGLLATFAFFTFYRYIKNSQN